MSAHVLVAPRRLKGDRLWTFCTHVGESPSMYRIPKYFATYAVKRGGAVCVCLSVCRLFFIFTIHLGIFMVSGNCGKSPNSLSSLPQQPNQTSRIIIIEHILFRKRANSCEYVFRKRRSTSNGEVGNNVNEKGPLMNGWMDWPVVSVSGVLVSRATRVEGLLSLINLSFNRVDDRIRCCQGKLCGYVGPVNDFEWRLIPIGPRSATKKKFGESLWKILMICC